MTGIVIMVALYATFIFWSYEEQKIEDSQRRILELLEAQEEARSPPTGDWPIEDKRTAEVQAAFDKDFPMPGGSWEEQWKAFKGGAH